MPPYLAFHLAIPHTSRHLIGFEVHSIPYVIKSLYVFVHYVSRLVRVVPLHCERFGTEDGRVNHDHTILVADHYAILEAWCMEIAAEDSLCREGIRCGRRGSTECDNERRAAIDTGQWCPEHCPRYMGRPRILVRGVLIKRENGLVGFINMRSSVCGWEIEHVPRAEGRGHFGEVSIERIDQ